MRHPTQPARPPAQPAGGPEGDSGRAWDALLVFTGAFMVFAVARVHLLFPALDVVRPVLIAGAFSVGLYLVDRHPARSIGALASPPFLLLLGLLVWMAFGTPFALRQGATFNFVVDNFTRTVALFLVVAGCVRGFRDAERLAWLYFGGAVLYTAVVLVRFEVGGDVERLSDLYTYDANDFALLCVTALPFGFYFLLQRGRSAVLRAFEAAGVLILSAGFVWSGSRGGFVALLAATIVFLVRFRAVPVSWRMAGGTVVAVVVLAVAGQQFWERMGTVVTFQEDYNITSPTGRWQIWERGIGYMMDRPVFGVGASNFAAAEGMISPRAYLQEFGIGVRWSAPHNSFLQVGAETGIPGLLLFLAFLASVFVSLRRVERTASGGTGSARGPPQTMLAQAIGISLVGFLVGAFFLSHAYSSMLYVLAALAVGLEKVSTDGMRRQTGGRVQAPRAIGSPSKLR